MALTNEAGRQSPFVARSLTVCRVEGDRRRLTWGACRDRIHNGEQQRFLLFLEPDMTRTADDAPPTDPLAIAEQQGDHRSDTGSQPTPAWGHHGGAE